MSNPRESKYPLKNRYLPESRYFVINYPKIVSSFNITLTGVYKCHKFNKKKMFQRAVSL